MISQKNQATDSFFLLQVSQVRAMLEWSQLGQPEVSPILKIPLSMKLVLKW